MFIGVIVENQAENKTNLTVGAVNFEKSVQKEIVATENAPGAIGPYSQAVKAGDFVFVSEDVAEQTEQVFKNLSAVLEAAGSSLKNVVKTTVFLADMNDFARMNEVYARYFTENYPARATVQAARLPKDARVEIEAIALLSGWRVGE